MVTSRSFSVSHYLQKILLVWAHHAVPCHGTPRHDTALSCIIISELLTLGSLLFPQLLASSYSIKKMLLKHNHLMAFLQCINHFPVDT